MKIKFSKKLLAIIACLFATTLFFSCKDDPKQEPAPDKDGMVRLELDYLDFAAAGGEEEIGLKAETDWKVVTASESWLKVSPTEGESSPSQTLLVSVGKNEESGERKAHIIVKALSGSSADTLTIRQAGTSRYVDIGWENEAKLTQFDLKSGNIKIDFDGNAPGFTPEVSAIVVPTDTMSYIRVVKSATTNGKSVTLQTVEGNMTDIFMNQEFTLSFLPNPEAKATRSGRINTTDKQGVIHPEKIVARMKDGKELTLYDISIGTKSGNINVPIWDKKVDYTDSVLYQKNGLLLYWKKCVFTGNVGANFYFSFNSEEKTIGGVPFKTGRLDNFYCFFNGDLGMDLLLALQSTLGGDGSTLRPILDDFINITATFNVGGIPVPVTVKADLILETLYDVRAEAELSAGFNMQAGVRFGVNYINGAIAPIREGKFSFEPYPLTLSVVGKADLKASLYPYIKVRFYNLAGPNIAYKPVFGVKEAVGTAVSTDPAQNYAGWQAAIYSQGALQGSLSLEFIGTHTSEPVTAFEEENYILRTPAKIELVSPSETGGTFTEGTPIEVRFRVTDYLCVTDRTLPTANAIVRLDASGGKTDKRFYKTNKDGEITVVYTPEKDGDHITANIIDEEGEAIDKVIFKPELKESKFNLVGTWKHRTGNVAQDLNGKILGEVFWDDILIIREDGSYHYTHNPMKVLFQYTDSEGNTQTSLSYGYCYGSYVFNEWPLQITLEAGPIVNESTSNGSPNNSPLLQLHNVFGKSGTYRVLRGMNDDGSLSNSIFGVEFRFANGDLSNLVFTKISDSPDGKQTISPLKSSIPPYINYVGASATR